MPIVPLIPPTLPPTGRLRLTITPSQENCFIEMEIDLDHCSPDQLGQIHGLASKAILESLTLIAQGFRDEGEQSKTKMADLLAGYQLGLGDDEETCG